MGNDTWACAVDEESTLPVPLQTPSRVWLHLYEAAHKCSVGLAMMYVSNIFMLQMMGSHHSPLANVFGMAVCSGQTYVFKQFWTRSTQEANNFFFLNYPHLCDTKRKKRRICIPNFRKARLLGDPFLGKVNSYELHSLNMFQYKH